MIKKSLLALVVAVSLLTVAESAHAWPWRVYGGYYAPRPVARAYAYGPAYRTYYRPGVVVAPPYVGAPIAPPVVVGPPVYNAPVPIYAPRRAIYGYYYYPGFGPGYYYY